VYAAAGDTCAVAIHKHTSAGRVAGNLLTAVVLSLRYWDFWSLLPEALHQVAIVMSDRGIPRSFRHRHGFGRHTFSMINEANERVWVKFHFRTQQGIENLIDEGAAALVGRESQSHSG
jgi:catalase